MKTLYLIRHAKAEEHALTKSDFNRNLIPKGKERAKTIAKELAGTFNIDNNTYVLSSSAHRALQTAEIFCEALQFPLSKIQVTDHIYEAHFTAILKEINTVSKEYDKVLVFGHNPGLSNLINYLSHAELELATSHVAILQLEPGIEFSILSGGTANLVGLLK
ncbi:SixA phosphatase family protein [Sphingobacterium sp. HJSM2_6]|uniref:SixA phosphatase family protein n=1 Tax=Sphingobacterium sp. HJSM2_6 TaxID=3366264 RepID=UPI003BDE103D